MGIVSKGGSPRTKTSASPRRLGMEGRGKRSAGRNRPDAQGGRGNRPSAKAGSGQGARKN